jgi:CBS domain-containing protein
MNPYAPVRHVMTRDPVCVELDTPPSTARRLLSNHPFHHLPVVRSGRIVGILSLADLLPHALSAYVADAATVDAHLDAVTSLERLMTMEPETVGPDDSLLHAATLLADGRFHAVPVVDGEGAVLGILTTTDIVRHFVGLH